MSRLARCDGARPQTGASERFAFEAPHIDSGPYPGVDATVEAPAHDMDQLWINCGENMIGTGRRQRRPVGPSHGVGRL